MREMRVRRPFHDRAFSAPASCLVGVCLAASALAAGAEAASTGSGTFRFEKVTTKFVAACAFRIPDPLVAGKTQTVVALAERPIDCAAADAGFDPIAAAKAQVGKASGWLSFAIEEGGGRAEGEWSSPKKDDGYPFGLGGSGKLSVTVNTASRVEGRWYTVRPETFFKETFEFDVRFAADVLAGSVSGTPLPKGGGEPGKVFQAYTKAIAASDKKTLQSVMTAEAYAEKAPMIALSKDIDLKTATIVGGLVKGDAAVLEVEGASHADWKMRGRVHMVKDAGAWKVVDTKLRVIQ